MDDRDPTRAHAALPKWVKFALCNESGLIERGAARRIAFQMSWGAFGVAAPVLIGLFTLQPLWLRWLLVPLLPFALFLAGMAVWHWIAIWWGDRRALWNNRR